MIRLGLTPPPHNNKLGKASETSLQKGKIWSDGAGATILSCHQAGIHFLK